MMSNYFLNYFKISQILSDRLYSISVVHDYWAIPEVDSGYLDTEYDPCPFSRIFLDCFFRLFFFF